MNYTLACAALLVTQLMYAQGKPTAGATLTNNTAAIDALFHQAYPANSPGAAVLIAKGDTVLYRKAFGMANLELGVQMQPESVFQLASITKQFTSVAILMLMEQGKLSLQDPLSTYIADFPRGDEITLHHLLNHTSGIKSYTNSPEFRSKTRLDMTPEAIIAGFKEWPLEFNPNEKHAYSNSGYFLLGYIIEQRSGMSYGDFIQRYIFDQLGMQHSYYADAYKVIPNRVSGYQCYEGNCENADYMSTTIPYAAGSLMSTIDDLFLWYKAIHNNLLISESSKRMAFTNHTLNNGTPTNYGYGWYINELAGTTTIEHPGGMNGFTTSGIYVPDSNLYAVVLTNCDDGKGPEVVNLKAVSALLGQPVTETAPVTLSEKAAKKWVGAYQFEEVVRFITYDEGVLYSTREGGRPLRLEPLSDGVFRFENSFATYHFSLKNGKKHVRFTDRIAKSRGVETDKQPVSEKTPIVLAPEILVKYTGVYELQPAFYVEIELRNNRLFAITEGQPAVELFAEAGNRFFIREIGAGVVFQMNPDETVSSLVFSQGGHNMEGKKIK